MKRPITILTLLSILVLLTGVACDTGTDRKGAVNETKTLAFTDSSRGLPSSGQWRHTLAYYDLNGDGHMDILAPPARKAGPGNGVPFAWYGNGKGDWTESRLDVPADTPYDYGAIGAADFDGDGISDIALAMHGLGLKVLKGVGNEKYVDFSKGIPPKKEFASRALALADFNNDGKPDIAAVSESRFGRGYPLPSGVRVCFLVDREWKCRQAGDRDTARNLFSDQLVVGDVNGDQNLDVAVASVVQSKNLIVWVGDGKGGFVPFNNGLPQEMFWLSVAVGDMNGDGKDDLLASIAGLGLKSFKGLRAFLSVPEGFREISEGLPGDDVFNSVALCDLDGNGRVEMVGGTGTGGIKVFTLNGEQWREVNTSGLPGEGLQKIWGVACVDLNGDGWTDIAVNYGSEKLENGGIRVFLNRPPE